MTLPPSDAKELVRAGYDRISEAYRSYAFDLSRLEARGFSILEEWLIPEDDPSHAAFLARLGPP